MSQFSFEIFCLTVPKIIVGEPFCPVFQKISGSQKSLWIRGGRGEYQDFASKIFCLTVPKKFIGEHFWGVTDFGYRKILC